MSGPGSENLGEPSVQTEYDLVFIGGGTAACITASRLATAFPGLSILVWRGADYQNKKEHIQPGQLLTHLAPTSKAMQFYTSRPSEHLGGRSVVVPSGRCVGGGSSDFGNVGWSSKDLIPMLQKAETYEIGPMKPTHGSDGPLKVSFGGSPTSQIGREFIAIGSKFENHRPESDEGNALNVESINVFFLTSSSQHQYVYQKHLGNLSVFDGCLVNRVVIKDGVAIGVEYLFDKRVHESSPQDIRLVKARKLVIVSAGAMGSPLILERSGIGRKDVLGRAGIPVVADIPGVGENYQDHAFLVTHIFGIDGGIKFRPRPEELAEFGPGFIEYWNDVLAAKPDKPLCLLGVVSGPVCSPRSQLYFSGAFWYGYPQSRGYLHISSSDPYAAPDFLAGFLSNPVDVVALRWAYKKCREFTRRLPSFRGALVPAHPQFSQDSLAALTETETVPLEAPNIVYTAEDELTAKNYLHLGTCAMKPLEQGGVVDSKLNVHGVKNLKVADLSIPPSNVNSNTYSTAIAIGEKAAVIIAKELGGSI
ncbi:hypothetical protein B0H13DRAFT_2233870 [Mycena leptocephala]|nr:hypothetical protein B0H13DRAFT_2233870 [Mycena leptocephala]